MMRSFASSMELLKSFSSAVMLFVSEHTKVTEERTLEKVYYAEGATVNIISQGTCR